MGMVNLLLLDGTTAPVNTAEVTSLRPIPANLLPPGVPAGTFCDHESGARYNVNATVAATLATIANGGTFLVALTDLNGNAVHANPDLVSGILTLPASVLPAGVANGCSIEFDNATALKVQGTAAAAATALGAGGSGSILAQGSFTGAGVLNAGSRGVTSVVRNAAGDYTLTFAPPVPTGALLMLTPNPGGGLFRSAVLNAAAPAGANPILTADLAAAAADSAVMFVLFSP